MDELLREIKRQLKAATITKKGLARTVGISRSTLYSILDGEYTPNVELAERIAAAVGFDLTFVRIPPRKSKSK